MSKLVMKKISLLLVAVVLLIGSIQAATTATTTTVSEEQQQQQTNSGEFDDRMVPRSRYVAVPSALTRFLLYNAAHSSDSPQAAASNSFGYKRSSSALDALTGVTLGKRSPVAEYINLEPFFGRQYNMRSLVPRMLVSNSRASWTSPKSTSGTSPYEGYESFDSLY